MHINPHNHVLTVSKASTGQTFFKSPQWLFWGSWVAMALIVELFKIF